MRVLIVGAGAVGQVFGTALHRAGWTVHYLVKSSHLERSQGSIAVHSLGLLRGARTHTWAPASWVTEPDAVEVDLTLWTVPTPVLYTDWLPRFLEAQGHVPAVLLQPGLDELERVRALRPDMELTQGLISLIAFAPPLPGGPPEPSGGTAVWVPVGVRSPLAGPSASRLAEALSRGGLPATEVEGLRAASAFGSAANSALVAALEVAGWRFRDVDVEATVQAIDEAITVTEGMLGEARPWPLRGVRPWSLRLLRWVAGRRVLPLDLEVYLEVHFRKVGAQTRLHLDELLRGAETLGRRVPELRHLRAALGDGDP